MSDDLETVTAGELDEHPHRNLIEGLRFLADWYEQHPDAREPTNGHREDQPIYALAMEYHDTFDALMARAHALGGEWRPDNPVRGVYFNLHLAGALPGFDYTLYCPVRAVGEETTIEETVTRTRFALHEHVAEALARLGHEAAS